jgi:O-antigen ligase
MPRGQPTRAAPSVPATGRSRYGLGFVLFLAVNAALFVRPSEIVPDLLGLEIYQFLILACLAFSFPAVLEQLTARALEARPITACVLGLLPAVILSHLVHFDFAGAALDGFEFFKIVVYYLLFAALVTTPVRLRRFLVWLLLCTAVVTLLAVLHYHGAIHLPNQKVLKALEKDQETGKEVVIQRLQGTGIFQDPNDLCILLMAGMLLALYLMTDRRSGLFGIAWLGPLGLFAYGLALTQSRGGFLALLVGLVVLLRARFGWTLTLVLGALLLPVLFVGFAGRQTSISTETTTGQERIQIWSDGIMLFRGAPLFGIGANKYSDEVGHVAHNSYLHAFTELGLLGGTLFVGAFACALGALARLRRGQRRIVLPELARLHPYLTGTLAGYASGMLFLTLNYIVPTYTMLGLAATYAQMTDVRPPLAPVRCDTRLAGRLLLLSLGFLAGMYVFVRLFFHH